MAENERNKPMSGEITVCIVIVLLSIMITVLLLQKYFVLPVTTNLKFQNEIRLNIVRKDTNHGKSL